MRTTLVLCAALCGSIVMAPFVAHAAPPQAPSQPKERTKEEWEARHKKATELAAAGRMEEARAIFEEIYAARPGRGNLWNLALAEIETKRYLPALRHLRQYQRESPKDDPDAALVAKHLQTAYNATGHVRVDAHEAVRVYVDGQLAPAEARSEPVDVEPGKRVVEGTLPGKKQRLEVEAPAGKVAVAKIDIAPVGGNLIFNGPGPDPTTPPPSFWTTRNTVAVILGGTALASFGAGTAFGLVANSKKDTASSLSQSIPEGGCPTHPSCASLKDAIDSQRSNSLLSNVFLVGGGVLTLATVGVLLLVPNGKPEAKAPVITPAASPQGAGFQITGSF